MKDKRYTEELMRHPQAVSQEFYVQPLYSPKTLRARVLFRNSLLRHSGRFLDDDQF